MTKRTYAGFKIIYVQTAGSYSSEAVTASLWREADGTFSIEEKNQRTGAVIGPTPIKLDEARVRFADLTVRKVEESDFFAGVEASNE